MKVPVHNDDPSSWYVFLDLEMMACTSILKEDMTGDATELERNGPFDPTFLTDVIKVNEILLVMIHPVPRCVYINPKRGIAPNGRRNYRIIFYTSLDQGIRITLPGIHRVACITWNGSATP